MIKNLLKALWKYKKGRAGLILVGCICFAALAAPILTGYNPETQCLEHSLTAPGWNHLFGTDFYGRDVFCRVLFGSRISLGIALVSAVLATFLGVILGLLAGFKGGWPDRIIMRFTDVMLGFPKLPLLIMVIGLGASSITNVIFILVVFSWMEIARITRIETIIIRESWYIRAAEGVGLSKTILFKYYIMPNIAGPVLAAGMLLICNMIFLEATLSFLGVGIQEPIATWGTILNRGRTQLGKGWWIIFFSGFVVIWSVVGFNLLGDAVRHVLEPKEIV